ncbi:RICIN domain-containing protein [Nonomuraea sp. NPDC050643]|uniref:RICIN domain-containing protein n=1 Tax=Nonomuraea sp. NPDC050643 TaxID=3155660 RepID=UPI0033CA7B8C
MRRLLFSIITGLTMLLSLVLTPSAAQAADFPFATIPSNAIAASRCFGPLNGGTADGTPIVLMDCNQLWHGFAHVTFTDNSIRHFSGKCLSMANTSSPVPIGTRLVLRDCSRVALGDQQWIFWAVTPGGLDGIWVLRNPGSLRCAGLNNNGTAIGTPLVVQPCDFRLTQQWLLPDRPSRFGFGFDDGTTV